MIDRKGVIRLIQGRGICEKDSENRTARRECEVLKRKIEALLEEGVSDGEAVSNPPVPAQ